MRKKVGQISLFIIVGFLLLIAAGILLVVKASVETQTSQITQGLTFNQITNNIEVYTQQCVKNSAVSTLAIFGAIGTTVNSPGGAYETEENLPIAYLRIDSNKYLPTIEEWEETLSKLYKLTSCDYTAFKDYNVEIEAGEIEAEINIKENLVEFNINQPIKISQDNNVKTLGNFKISLPARLQYVNTVINDIITREINLPGYIPLSTLSDYEVDVKATNLDGFNYIYIIEEKDPNYQDIIVLFADKDGVILE